MARQVRSEATRQKILDAAIEVFGEVGYAAAAWGTIIERTGMTKGAMYHHFDSKESLASAIIEAGSDSLLMAFRNVCGSSSPALENMIHGTFTIANVLSSDKMARAAEQLAFALTGFNDAATRFYEACVELMAAEASRASAEGDLRPDLDATAVSESIVGAVLGTRLLSNAIPTEDLSADLVRRTAQVWQILLAGMVTDVSLPYFQQFLVRGTLRYAQPPADPRAANDLAPDVK